MVNSWDPYRAPEHLSTFGEDARDVIERIDHIYQVNQLGMYIPERKGERLDVYPQYAEQIRLLVEITSEQLRNTDPSSIADVYTVLDALFDDIASGRSESHAYLFYRALSETESLRGSSDKADQPIVLSADLFAERMQTLMGTWAADKS